MICAHLVHQQAALLGKHWENLQRGPKLGGLGYVIILPVPILRILVVWPFHCLDITTWQWVMSPCMSTTWGACCGRGWHSSRFGDDQ